MGLSPLAILGILLALSIAGNAALFKLRDAAIQDAATAQSAYQQAVASALQCSEGVKKLALATADREKRAKDAVRAAQGARAKADARALQTLQTPPSVPEDACKSAEVLNSAKLLERRNRPPQ